MDERVFRRSPFVFAAKRALAYATRKEVTFFYVSPPPAISRATRGEKTERNIISRIFLFSSATRPRQVAARLL